VDDDRRRKCMICITKWKKLFEAFVCHRSHLHIMGGPSWAFSGLSTEGVLSGR
jgi:hypothetical protein